ncbi:MAG TPA: hypothetical protein DET40_21475 [Lentisphaeria bacterium]|nr:MAG: hypothetical protein A2X45_03385 [Lentisphaerae bacterium GWF2_50_93]HCE46123.1 hypothetical protein [Lentisphaeria bacterium]
MPEINTRCSKCRSVFEIDESFIGLRTECPECGELFVIDKFVAESARTYSEWSEGQSLFDDFVVERVLGQGGMGKVYLVKNLTTQMLFAVKRATKLKENDRQNFLAELQTWIDLPEHPNLVSCRFFRMYGDEILIFADYVECGSLEELIIGVDGKPGRLYKGSKQEILKQILDISIQFAWGLHCLHELGLIHQDVKPGNVLLSGDFSPSVQGVKAKVTDYGLARARSKSGEKHGPMEFENILLSCGGYSPAYCSPEQANMQKLSRGTDVWSWGVSVMEMFTGGVSWSSGSVANEVLGNYMKNNDDCGQIPLMPDGLAEILVKCFQPDSERRWNNLGEVTEKLKKTYHETIGAEYGRILSRLLVKQIRKNGVGERRGRCGTSWREPRLWLEQALREDGRNPLEASEILSKGDSRRGQLVADIAACDAARHIFEKLVKNGRNDLSNILASLCMDEAIIHKTADDFSGAITLYDKAIVIRERLVNIEGRSELENDLVTLYMVKGNALIELKDNHGAGAFYDKAIVIRERLVNIEGRSELKSDLASLYMGKAVLASNLGDNSGAVALYDKAIEVLECLVNIEGRSELKSDLASLYMNKAIAVKTLGDSHGSVALYDKAIEIMEHIVNIEDRSELKNDLANLYMNKALLVSYLGDNRGAVTLYDKAIVIRERLVNIEGRSELEDGLADLYMNKASALYYLGDNHGTLALYDKAIEIREHLVSISGNSEQKDDLASSLMGKAVLLKTLGDSHGAVALYDKAIEIRERLFNVKGGGRFGRWFSKSLHEQGHCS